MHDRRESRAIGSHILAWVALLVAAPGTAGAQLIVTPTNAGRGFTVTDFVTAFPASGTIGPIGIAFGPSASVLVTNLGDNNMYSFPSHSDGQTAAATNILRNYAPTTPFSMAEVQIGSTWHIYASLAGDIVEIDPATGDYTVVAPGAGGLGMAPYPAGLSGPHAGHIFVAGSAPGGPTVWEFDPVGVVATPFVQHVYAGGDGLAISADGAHMFWARGDSLVSIGMTSLSQDWGAPAHMNEGYDGVAVGLGTLDGYVYVNCNSGSVYEFGTPWGSHAGIDNLLLTGGTRGDFIAVDPNVTSGGFPSLLLTQTSSIVRLDPPGGGWFGPPTSSTQPVGGGTGAVGSEGPFVTRLLATAPNPAAGATRIDYVLGHAGHVRIEVLDLQGRQLATVLDGVIGAGTHQAEWNGASANGPAPAGVYYVRMTGEGVTSTRTIVLAR